MSTALGGGATTTGDPQTKPSSSSQQHQQKKKPKNPSLAEISHYVVTAHPPGSVLATAQCNFVAPDSLDVLIAKSGRLEVRQSRAASSSSTTTSDDAGSSSNTNNNNNNNLGNPFPLLFQVPIYGRITHLVPFSVYHSPTSLVFFLTDRHQYGVLGYDNTGTSMYPIVTHASGSVSPASLWNQGGPSVGGGGSGHLGGSGTDGGAAPPSANWINDNALAVLGRESETPSVIVDPLFRCLVLHLHVGLLAVLPIQRNYNPAMAALKSGDSLTTPPRRTAPATTSTSSSCLGPLFHVRLEEKIVLDMGFLQFPAASAETSTTPPLPHIVLLHQDARHVQHLTTHVLNLTKRQLYYCQSTAAALASSSNPVEWLRKTAVDGGSAMLLPVPPLTGAPPPVAAAAAATPAPPPAATTASNNNNNNAPATSGGVVVVGQRQFTYCSSTTTKIIPVPQALYLSFVPLPADPNYGMPRFLLSDEFGNLHLLTLLLTGVGTTVLGLSLETLGSCNLSRDLNYLGQGLVYVASGLGDSQLIQIHDEPIPVTAQHDGHIDAGGADAMSGRGTTTTPRHNNPNNAANNNNSSTGDEMADASSDPAEDEPTTTEDDDMVLMADTTYIQVLEEYTNLGPILDFDLIPTAPPTTAKETTTPASSQSSSSSFQYQQSQVVTCSGSSKMGSLRLIRNGIGMHEYASVEIPGILHMWALRQRFDDAHDAYLVQSFVGQTRVLGVVLSTDARMDAPDDDDDDDEDDEPFGSLEEVVLPGLESNASTLYVGNLPGDRVLQITDLEIRLLNGTDGTVLDTWSNGLVLAVAAANAAGQVAAAQRGGQVLYFEIRNDDNNKIAKVAEQAMEREVSCLNLHPFQPQQAKTTTTTTGDAMDVDGATTTTTRSKWLAVGLWDDFTVRLLHLNEDLKEAQKIHLSSSSSTEQGEGEAEDGGGDATKDKNDEAAADDPQDTTSSSGQRQNRNNMMARSLCLITLDYSSSSNSNSNNNSAAGAGVDMLFVGLGDGSLISFCILENADDGSVAVRSKKEVCLGTQRIDLIPLSNQGGASCVLATGDRPTVIYLAGLGGGSAAGSASTHFNPKLCYSSVNLSASEDDDEEGGGGGGDDAVTRPSAAPQSIAVNVAAPFYSPLLFDNNNTAANDGGKAAAASQHYSLCIADETSLRLGVIDDIQKLHVTTCRLGMAPRRIVHCTDGRLFAVGCMESGIHPSSSSSHESHNNNNNAAAEITMGNCIRFMDDTNFDDIKRVDMEPFETILSMAYVSLQVPPDHQDSTNNNSVACYKPFLVVGTGYTIADEAEITRGRLLLYSCLDNDDTANNNSTAARTVRQVTELSTNGGVLSVCQFYQGTMLCCVNSKTNVCRLTDDAGVIKLEWVGVGHHGHVLSLFCKSRCQQPPPTTVSSEAAAADSEAMVLDGDAKASAQQQPQQQTQATLKKSGKKDAQNEEEEEEMLALVGDLMRSVSVVQYFAQHQIVEEVARDYNANWTVALEMLTDDIYLAGEHWSNLYCLRRNKTASSEEVRGRLDTVGEFHLAEMCNKFMRGSLVMPVSTSSSSSSTSNNLSTGGDDNKDRKGNSANNNNKSVRRRRPTVVTGSQTLFGTVDGSLGVILGLDGRTAAFFATLERALAKTLRPIGNLSHQLYRAFHGERRMHPAHGFVDGDLIEASLDLDKATLQAVVDEMNRDGGWDVDDVVGLTATQQQAPPQSTAAEDSQQAPQGDGDASSSQAATEAHRHAELTVEDVVAMVEEISMLH